MARTNTTRDHAAGPKIVDLVEPLPERPSDVMLDTPVQTGGGKLSEMVRSLPPGIRTKEDIDHQIDEERDSWR